MSDYHKPKSPPVWILDQIDKYFIYDEISGNLLRLTNNRKDFKIVGSDTGKALNVSISRKTHYVHHIVWYLNYKKWPIKLIDHKDQNYKNNKISNLRESNCPINQYNKPKKSGLPLGVHYRKDRKYNNFQSQISIKNIKYHLGFFSTPEEAHNAYKNRYKETYGVECNV